MKIHKKKILPQYYELRLHGVKHEEIRLNDCDYQKGDYIILREWEEGVFGRYTGREMAVQIMNVGKSVIGLCDGYVVLYCTMVSMNEVNEAVMAMGEAI